MASVLKLRTATKLILHMNKAAVLQAIIDALGRDLDLLDATSRKTREGGNDPESKAEGKYDTRSTEDNYLADGLARQAHAAGRAAAAYREFVPPSFNGGSSIDLGALVQLELAGEKSWFFLGPAGGGLEVISAAIPVTVLTPDSPLGSQLIGKKVGAVTTSPRAKVCAIE